MSSTASKRSLPKPNADGSYTVHFRIEGEWLTDLVRSLWADEGEPEKAINILQAAFPTMEQGDMVAILTGSKQLTGMSDDENGLDLVPDTTTESKYGNSLGLKQRFSVLQAALKEKTEEAADMTQFAVHDTVGVPSAKGLVVVPRRRTRMGGLTGSQVYLDPDVDLETIPHYECRAILGMPYGTKDGSLDETEKKGLRGLWEAKEEEKPGPPPEPFYTITTDTGWLSPDGKFYPCAYQGHVSLAYELGFDVHRLETFGWLKFQRSDIFWNFLDGKFKPTQQQIDLVWDWCQADLSRKRPFWLPGEKDED